jgi:hypothetical protein
LVIKLNAIFALRELWNADGNLLAKAVHVLVQNYTIVPLTNHPNMEEGPKMEGYCLEKNIGKS